MGGSGGDHCVAWSPTVTAAALGRYATLAGLAGLDPTDTRAAAYPGVPGIDSIDVWPALMTPHANESDSPRQQMVLAYGCHGPPGAPSPGAVCPDGRGQNDSAMIAGRYKIIFGPQNNAGFWSGPVHPNGTVDPAGSSDHCGPFSCCDGCLFDIISDPTEHRDLSAILPDVFSRLRATLHQEGLSMWQTNYSEPNTTCISARDSYTIYRHFDGPRCFRDPPPIPLPPPGPPLFLMQHGAKCLLATNLKLGSCDQTARIWSANSRGNIMTGSQCLKVFEHPLNCSHDGMRMHLGVCDHANDPHNGFRFMTQAGEGRLASGTCSGMCASINDSDGLVLIQCAAAKAGGWKETSSTKIATARDHGNITAAAQTNSSLVALAAASRDH